jgi:FimV-like protein
MSNPTPDALHDAMGRQLFAQLEALPGSRRLKPEQLEVIYSLAYAHVVQNQHAQALPIFAFLVQYGPTRRHYLAGLALCLHAAGRFDEAVNMHSLALVLFPEHLEPALHMAESLAAKGDIDAARHLLKQVVATDTPELSARAATLLERLARREEATT